MSDEQNADLKIGLGGRAYNPWGIPPAGYAKFDPHIEVERKRIVVRRLELQVEEAKLDLQQTMVNLGMLGPVRETADKDEPISAQSITSDLSKAQAIQEELKEGHVAFRKREDVAEQSAVPLQHKGGETEAGDSALAEFMKLDGAVKWDGGEQPVSDDTEVETLYRNGRVHRESVPAIYDWGRNFFEPGYEIIAYRIISSSEADSGPGSSLAQGDERIEQTISTLQASSGEGGERLPESTEPGSGDWTSAERTKPTEPAAYSPVNNADEPVTKPEADVFYHGLQAEAESKKEPGIFGGIFQFGKKPAAEGVS